MQRPELVQDEQQLLRTTQREHRDQALAGPHHNVPDRVREPLLPFLARLVQVHAVRGLDDEHIRLDGGHLGLYQVSPQAFVLQAYQQNVDGGDVHSVDERQSVDANHSRVDAKVELFL